MGEESKIKAVKSIETKHNEGISALCFLKDKRLVSASFDKSIIVYDKSYQLQIHIEDAHYDIILSLCVLRSGELVSTDRDIKIWRINESDYKLVHTLKGHRDAVYKVIELKNGKLWSCSEDGTIKVWDNFQCIQTISEETHFIFSIIEMKNFIVSDHFLIIFMLLAKEL